ncbi:MAG: sodium-dependent transporter [Eubacteriales bacterium]|nr:sodium-dependent transporter [Eubacteriales bacterium]
MENNRGSWGSNIGFILAAVGSAVGLGNIWGFPYKMGKSGGFTFLLVYICLAVIVGLTVMASELALGRMTGKGVVDAYRTVSKKFKWIGWLGIIAPFLIMSFYSVLGAYCVQYMSLNLAELSFGLSGIFGATISGGETFGAMLTNPFGCAIFTFLFMVICMLIVKGGVSGGIEKFNKIGMPALFVMLVIVIIRSLTLPNAVEGLKFMFKPGYAVEGGFIEKAPGFVEVLGTAGGQMFFSLSLAMGAMVTYGSYLDKKENLVKNSGVIVFADTLVALMAGLAVIPAAVANGINNGVAVGDITLSGPKLLFVTLQDVFSNMGSAGPLFGVIFYALVIIAAISSAISLMEVMATFFIDRAAEKGQTANRTKITLWVSVAIMLEALLVAVDGLGSNGVWVPGQAAFGVDGWNDCWLDFMDCWSEGVAMPVGSMLMALMIGWELKPEFALKEIHNGNNTGWFTGFYTVCIKFLVPIIMAFVFVGQLQSFFASASNVVLYAISGVILVAFWIFAASGKKE